MYDVKIIFNDGTVNTISECEIREGSLFLIIEKTSDKKTVMIPVASIKLVEIIRR